jgi:hypothetical protein
MSISILGVTTSISRLASRLTDLRIVALMLVVAPCCYVLTVRPDLACSEKWLNAAEYDDCFQRVAAVRPMRVPQNVTGRRSYFGIGNDEYKAEWVSASSNTQCWDSRSGMGRDRFDDRATKATEKGYRLVSSQTFVGADGKERVQATWRFDGVRPENFVCDIDG